MNQILRLMEHKTDSDLSCPAWSSLKQKVVQEKFNILANFSAVGSPWAHTSMAPPMPKTAKTKIVTTFKHPRNTVRPVPA